MKTLIYLGQKKDIQITEKHHYTMMTFALRLTQNKCDAEDLVQDTYLKVLTSKKEYEERGYSITSWMKRIMVNHITKSRAKPTIPIYDIPMQELYERFGYNDHTYEESFSDETQKGLSRINPDLRDALLMSLDYQYREISERLNMPIGTIMSRINRAKEQFIKTYTPKDKVIKQLCAGDIVYVQLRDKRWHVWCGFKDNNNEIPTTVNHRAFVSNKNAMEYAASLEKDNENIKYGIYLIKNKFYHNKSTYYIGRY